MKKYFVSFKHVEGFESCDIIRESAITSIEDISEIQTFIENTYRLRKVRIIFWKLFDQE